MPLRIPASAPTGAWRPADNGFVACDVDPILASGTTAALTAGVMYLRKLRMASTSPITNVVWYVNTAGATVTNAFTAIYDAAGNRLGVSADVSSALQGTLAKSNALVTPTDTLPADTWVYAALLVGAAGTYPLFRATGAAIATFGLSAPATYRWASTGTGLTACPASFTPSSVAAVTGAIPIVGLT